MTKKTFDVYPFHKLAFYFTLSTFLVFVCFNTFTQVSGKTLFLVIVPMK